MHASFSYLAAMIACTLCAMVATTVSAQSAKDIRGPSPLVAIDNEPPAKIIVDPPLAEQLAKGLVFIQYRAENLRVVPVFRQRRTHRVAAHRPRAHHRRR